MEEGKLPSSFRKCFFVGLGLGAGIAIGIYVVKKFSQNNGNRELVLALNGVSHEIRELRGSIVVHLERTTTTFLNEEPRRLYPPASNNEASLEAEEQEQQEESSSEEDFFEFQEDDLEISNKESFQENNLDINKLIKECDELSEKNNIIDNEKEIKLLEDLLSRNPDNVEVLWRFARAQKNKASFLTSEDDEEKKNITYKAMGFCKKSLEIDENNGDAHKWYAILLGLTAEYSALKEKIALGHKYKEHIMKAIQLKPQDPTVHYLMGRWSFEVAMLPWWQRQAAAAFVDELPTSTFDDALANFHEAEKLNPGFFKSNTLFIGKCYQQLGDWSKAKEWVEKSLHLPAKDEEDNKAHEEATTILAGL